jgi:hypothetical protein
MLWVACPELPDLNEHRGLHRRIRNFVRERDDLVIVAVGGGSVLDLAKVMSLARSQMEFEDVFTERIAMGKRIDKLQHVPVIAVPTTGVCLEGVACISCLYLFIILFISFINSYLFIFIHLFNLFFYFLNLVIYSHFTSLSLPYLTNSGDGLGSHSLGSSVGHPEEEEVVRART